MLKKIRGALKGVLVWVFVILGVTAFSIVGVPELQTFQQKPPIKVGNVSVSRSDMMDKFNQALRQEQSQAGRAFSREEALAGGLKERVISDLAVEAVIRAETKKLGLTMPRKTVSKILNRDERFRSNLSGKFDEKVLADILRTNSLTPKQFDQLIRDQFLRQTLIDAASAGPDAPRKMIDIFLARQTEQRRVTWLTVTDAMTTGPVDPTPEDLQTQYAANPQAYTSPEYRTISVAFLRNEDFEADLDVPEEELRETYDLNRETLYEEPETRTLYQLTYTEENEAAAATARLRTGVPFETLAIERGTTLAASTLTNATRQSIIDQTVADAAFASELEPGTVLDPVPGLFGTTVLQLVDITPKKVKSFEEVRDDIRTALLSQQTQRLANEKLEAIEVERDQGTSLRDAAESAGINIRTFGPVDRLSFTPGGAILDGIPGEVLKSAFEDLTEGEESEALELSDNKGYLITVVDEVTAPALKPFEEVADEVEQAWQTDQRRGRINDLSRVIIERVKAGEALSAVGESMDRAPINETLSIASRQHSTISQTLKDKIFAADLNATISGDAVDNSASIIAITTEITYARGSIQAAELERYKQFLGLQLNSEFLQAYVQTMQQEYGIAFNQDLIDRTFAEAN